MSSSSLKSRATAKLRAARKQLGNRLSGYPAHFQHPPQIEPNPANPRGHLAFCALTKSGFAGEGKMLPHRFLPPFCREIQAQGIAVHFCSTVDDITAVAGPNTALIHIYKEEWHPPKMPAFERAGLQFHTPEQAAIVSRKDTANEVFSRHGVLMPPIVQHGGATESPVFSNEFDVSGAEVELVTDPAALNPDRYNTAFIDTRRSFEGAEYYTCIRLMSVGSQMIHAWVRARDAAEGSPSVHSKSTPLNPALIEHLHAELVTPNLARFEKIAQTVSEAVGPAFLSHDVLVERGTEDIYLCESGFKFDNSIFHRRFLPFKDALPSLKVIFSNEIHHKSARAMVAYCEEKGIYSVS